MPSIDINILLSLKDNYKNYSCFIETGTLEGQSIKNMEPYFDTLYTIEISEKYFQLAKQNYFGNKINFLLGDSTYVLPDLVKKIKSPTIFFLDGHYSSGNTGKGEKDVPLLEELQSINDLFTMEAIIIIDDVRLFGKIAPEDFTLITIENIRKILNSRISLEYFLNSELAVNDRMVVHLSKIS
jgi:predicted O-methyltransferase YrrM